MKLEIKLIIVTKDNTEEENRDILIKHLSNIISYLESGNLETSTIDNYSDGILGLIELTK